MLDKMISIGTLLVVFGSAAPSAVAAPPRPALRLYSLELPPSGALRLAQSDEPTPPKEGGAASDDASKKDTGDEPAKPAGGDEPTAPGQRREGEDPAKAVDEPGNKGVDEPAQVGPTEAELKKKKTDRAVYGVGLQLRAIFIHEWFLGLFLDESTPLNSMAFGGEFIRRKGDLDLIASVDFGFYSPQDGNYLGKNKNPVNDTDYVEFRGLNILSFSAHFIWHQEMTEWLSFVYGVGVGLGVVLGDVYRISNDPSRCTRENAGDINLCFPRGLNPQTREEDLKRLTGGNDSPADPHLFKEDDVPPVIPMLHFLVGFNFKVSEQVSVRVDGGFRNAFYIGAASHWFF